MVTCRLRPGWILATDTVDSQDSIYIYATYITQSSHTFSATIFLWQKSPPFSGSRYHPEVLYFVSDERDPTMIIS